MGRKEKDYEEMYDKFSRQYDTVSERMFEIFEEMGFPTEMALDFMVTSIASICLLSDSPMKDAKDVGRILSLMVKEMMKDGYGSKLRDRLETL